MPNILFELDPTSEDATNVPVVLTDATWRVMEMDLSPPDVDPMYASSADTEGEPLVQGRHHNRTISLTLLAKSTTDALTQTAVQGLMMKLDKQRREGGTLKWTTQAGTVVVADVLFAQVKSEITPELYVANKAVKLSVDFACEPYLRGVAVQLSDHVETTLPVAIGVDTSVGGDVEATVKILIDEDQAADQYWLVWGLQSRYYDSAATAALFYEAEGRTALGGAATAVGPAGASGGGSNVVRLANPVGAWTAMLSTQATAAGAHLTHKGTFRVFARMQYTLSSGNWYAALDWTQGDFLNVTRNAPVALPGGTAAAGVWWLVDLGLVTIDPTMTRWEGRIVVRTTSIVTAQMDVDYLMLVPAGEGSAEVSGVPQASSTPTVRDEFNQAAGALATKTLSLGGTWTGAGDTDDFTVETTGRTAQRATVSDTAGTNFVGRFAIAGTTTFTNVVAQVDFKTSVLDPSIIQSVFARYTDASNHLLAELSVGSTTTSVLQVMVRVAGVDTVIGTGAAVTYQAATYYTLRLTADTTGRVFVWWGPQGGALQLVGSGYHSSLATGGTLATGKVGFGDFNFGAVASTRNYDNFAAGVSAPDAAVFASQSLELRSDSAVRKDSAGAFFVRPSRYEGDYPKVPPAGKEARSVRFIVKASRNNPAYGPDVAIDDLSFRATVTPRYLQVPA